MNLQDAVKTLERVNKIINNDEYRQLVDEVKELEKDRIYCRHGMDHYLDVARIASLISLDEGFGIERDVIYAAALLHDIGRVQQYKDGTEHEIAGAALATPILHECGYTEDESAAIIKAIAYHGDETVAGDRDLTGLLYRADKASRKCYMCDAVDTCHKPKEKLVMEIKY